ncbi:trimethyllysine dioxygenase, mitochondrial [Synchiropus splendidus]|uniref:trimethyllysine dioxygenase, mitochondrial n=1 Tax=Synchiropus splendidus TaxID=270530 RepID=UPI00237DB7A7|nr:trimethyllysine dioxygenase, mitochondrial [Synchiropus splendidus]XP_053703319.1 trimethyllysine dioxygenase, mitochondrial [Synchiropus splendidus]XP_053703320.1 trimethyllysine dioxygenase, mitochondrial [Synchiropus splendidus]XP_053703321.1 trimethyllysine dioxygenase, mitochondrial [Synchiropus splendidus]
MFGPVGRQLRAAVKPAKLWKTKSQPLWRHRQVRAHAALGSSAALQRQDDCLVLHYGGKQMKFNYVWLRDNCRDESSYNVQTNQRNLDTVGIDLNIRPDHSTVERDQLILTWPGGHVTKYSLSWLADNSYEGKKNGFMHRRMLWNADIYESAKTPSAKWEKFMSCDEELKFFLQNYLTYGIAFVEGVPASVEATQEVVQRVSLIRETTYGRMWSFTSDLARGDTAYTQLALGAHTDTSYLQEPCGIQVFHCLRHDGTGGRNLLVDGFYAAERLRQLSPKSFELLTRVHVKHEHIESKEGHRNHLTGIGPLLEVYPWNKELFMIRYNDYDRTVIDSAPHDVVQQWYSAHRLLATELRRPENQLWVKLSPGQVIFVDNWRVLHGRESFSGLRQLCGCYLTRDDVLSTARCLGLHA